MTQEKNICCIKISYTKVSCCRHAEKPKILKNPVIQNTQNDDRVGESQSESS